MIRNIFSAPALLGFALILATQATAAQAPTEPVSVMILGTFHMSNPGRDIHNSQVDDVLSAKRQLDLAEVADGLAKFAPTQIDVEWPEAVTNERYSAYLKGTLKPSHNEVVQVGFRLAKKMKLGALHGVDVDGDFPYEAVMKFAATHGQGPILDKSNAEIESFMKAQDHALATGTIGAVLRFLNDPALVSQGNGFYRQMLRIGAGGEQPGADLLTAWYRRNFLICANIIQLAKPGDRIVVLYGSGHSFLLRQCISETPGFNLVEANDFLPR